MSPKYRPQTTFFLIHYLAEDRPVHQVTVVARLFEQGFQHLTTVASFVLLFCAQDIADTRKNNEQMNAPTLPSSHVSLPSSR